MNKKGILWVLISVLIVFNLIIWISLIEGQDRNLKVTFLDVGQGDAIFIESPSGIQLLVDSGPDTSVLRALGKEMRFFDRKIDAVLATHPDADHIGGFPEIFDRFKIDETYATGIYADTPVFDAYRARLKKEESRYVELVRGNIIDLGGGVIAEVLFPDRELKEIEPNTSSIILRISYGKTNFILTGDAPKEIEEYIALLDGLELDVDVLKLGHHGSRTSTSKAFLSATSPDYAIVSAGCGNRYGHPHNEVIENTETIGSEVLETCKEGSIIFESDGENILLK